MSSDRFRTAIDETACVFRHETQFCKSKVAKVFKICSPEQSGEVPHTHDYTQIWYVMRGGCLHDVAGREYTMTAGDAFVLPPQVSHRTVLQRDSSIICCEFQMEKLGWPGKAQLKLPHATENRGLPMLFQGHKVDTKPHMVFRPRGQQAVESLIVSMLEEYERAEPFFEEQLRLQIIQLFFVLARECIQQPNSDKENRIYAKYKGTVEDAVRYIVTHYSEPLMLEEVCRVSMVSKTYFCYLFKLLTGQTFVEYLIHLRVEKAEELLRETELSVTDIGQAVGFQDSTHFSRTFKRLRGISPRQYREAGRL